jgi:hypothetical protein
MPSADFCGKLTGKPKEGKVLPWSRVEAWVSEEMKLLDFEVLGKFQKVSGMLVTYSQTYPRDEKDRQVFVLNSRP